MFFKKGELRMKTEYKMQTSGNAYHMYVATDLGWLGVYEYAPGCIGVRVDAHESLVERLLSSNWHRTDATRSTFCNVAVSPDAWTQVIMEAMTVLGNVGVEVYPEAPEWVHNYYLEGTNADLFNRNDCIEIVSEEQVNSTALREEAVALRAQIENLTIRVRKLEELADKIDGRALVLGSFEAAVKAMLEVGYRWTEISAFAYNMMQS